MEKFHRAHKVASVLVIEPDPLLLTAIGGALNIQGHRATLARDEQVALQALAAQTIDLIILGIEQLESGCEIATRLRAAGQNLDVPIIFLVPQMCSHWAASLQAQGGVFCVLRSLDPHDLIDLVDKALWMPHLAHRRASPPPPHNPAVGDWVKLD